MTHSTPSSAKLDPVRDLDDSSTNQLFLVEVPIYFLVIFTRRKVLKVLFTTLHTRSVRFQENHFKLTKLRALELELALSKIRTKHKQQLSVVPTQQ